MKRSLKVLWALFRLRFSSASMYRLSFFTGFFVDVTVFVTQLIFLQLLAASAGGTWSLEQYAMFVGSFMTLDGVYMVTWFFGLCSIPDQIRSGNLDLALVRPVNPLFFLSFQSIDIGSLPIAIVGLIITFSAAAKAGCLTLGSALGWLIAMALMYCLMYALSLLIRVVAFWTKSINALTSVEGNVEESVMRLPLPAIKGAARALLLLIVPYGVIGNFPALVLSGQATALWWLYAVILTAGFCGLALWLWRKGLRRYESASS